MTTARDLASGLAVTGSGMLKKLGDRSFTNSFLPALEGLDLTPYYRLRITGFGIYSDTADTYLALYYKDTVWATGPIYRSGQRAVPGASGADEYRSGNQDGMPLTHRDFGIGVDPLEPTAFTMDVTPRTNWNNFYSAYVAHTQPSFNYSAGGTNIFNNDELVTGFRLGTAGSGALLTGRIIIEGYELP